MTATSGVGDASPALPAKVRFKRALGAGLLQTQVKTEIKTEPGEAIGE